LRILLLSHAFPPLNAIASHRGYGWARAWLKAGHEVHVLTPTKSVLDGPLDLDLSTEGLRLHTVPPWWATSWWATSPRATGSAVPRKAAWDLLKRRTRPLRDWLGLLGDIRMLLVPSLVRAGTRIISSNRFDVIVSSYGPASNLIAGSILAGRTAIPWVIDYQDLWSENYVRRRSGIATRISLVLERRFIRRAAMLVTLSHGLAARIEKSLGRRAVVAYFGHLEDEDDPPLTSQPVATKPSLVCAGRVYATHQTAARLFSCLGKVLLRRPHIRDVLQLNFYGPDQGALRQMARLDGAESVMRFNGQIPHREVLAIERCAAGLLFFDWVDRSEPGVMTGKLFEYFRTGRPIIFVGAGFETEASKMARRAGTAVVLQTDEEIEQFLEQWPNGMAAAMQPDYDFISELSCKRQAAIVLAQIQRELSGRIEN
jgi:hypothetical protein